MVCVIAQMLIITFWMLGGQFGSAWRKYGIMAVVVALVIWRTLHGGIWWAYIPLLGVCPELFLGYGDSSWFRKNLKTDGKVRLAEGLIYTLPVAATALLTAHYWSIPFAAVLLIGAFQIRAGGFKVGSKDFLWEDYFRSLALALAIGSVIR